MEFSCRNCENNFPNYVEMFNHLKSAHEAEVNPRSVPLFCQKCTKDFTSVKALKEHMKDHSDKKPNKPKIYNCFYDGCHEICNNLIAFRAHLFKPHNVDTGKQGS